jgi:hypothetical protein
MDRYGTYEIFLDRKTELIKERVAAINAGEVTEISPEEATKLITSNEPNLN